MTNIFKYDSQLTIRDTKFERLHLDLMSEYFVLYVYSSKYVDRLNWFDRNKGIVDLINGLNIYDAETYILHRLKHVYNNGL